MSTLIRSRRVRLATWLFAVGVAAVLLLATTLATPASAHGSVVDPASRNYGCWQRWGNDFQNPAMATQDPMCWQAWQHNTSAMWNWNGLYREGVAGNHQGAIPDGQLCSAGRTGDGRYNSLDAVGAWKTTSVANSFRVKLWDQASHGADYIRVYVTRQGFDALSKPLAWSDLELVGQIGNTPASRWTPESQGVSIQIPANAPGRTGRHIVYTIWQASHADQSYYLCSDVEFGGGPSTPPTTTPPPPTSPPPTTTPPTSPSPTTPPVTAGCTATYRSTGQWSGGFQGDVEVTAGRTAIRGWTVTWTLGSGQQITQSWNATVTTSGSTATARNASYNGALAAGAKASFGFIGSGPHSTPTLSCTATA
ncbi:lytic polysaccharide monooxygenase [Micromonospora sp. KC723]|uniref:lytic polysaccharide monooxygenase auxiliary activity family 9 protein n=1 Tax=Micromonospora sp. KC723 TaxID=2530381 RepID=UPI0010432866|nr:lytic polysaccharide monooxygenase [Micromonospora sp. KC723]TDB73008.1 cellulose-binding protein [Micromonospora sp. KC723]